MALRLPAPMRPHPTAATSRYPTAADVLGPAHPVARAAHARLVLARQLAANTALLAVVGVVLLVHRHATAVTLLSAAVVVQLWLVTGYVLAMGCLHERARDVIADGSGDITVAEIAAERRRLASASHRASLARSLGRAQHAAAHWPGLVIASRPPPGVRNLAEHPATAAEVIRLVRDPATPVRGVAVLDRLLCGGYGATLYTGPSDALGRELGRIRYLLAEAPPSMSDE